MYQPVSAIVLDTRKPIKTQPGKFSVKLRITYRSGRAFRQVYYPLKIYLSQKEFNTITKSPKNEDQRQIKEQLHDIETKAWKTCQLKAVTDRQSFEAVYFGTSEYTLAGYFNRTIKRMNTEGRYGSAAAYKNAIESLIQYHGPDLQFMDITPQWLEGYEKWMRSRDLTITTIGINLRALRAVFNEAISNGETSADLYPFRKYKIKTERKIKIPLTRQQVTRLKNYKSKIPARAKAVALWLFSYYCNGMNINDILSLQWKQVQGEYLVYQRNKTRRTNTDVRSIVIPMRKEVKKIIDRYGNKSGRFVFPYLETTPPAHRRRRVQFVTKNLNVQLKKVAHELNIDKLNNSLARHTYSNTLLNAGINKEFIQYALGHTDMKTTENYLAGFTMDKIKKAAEVL